MIRNIIFDFGSVLVDWNPELLYGPYFNDKARMDMFLTEICPHSWNVQADEGRSTAEITEERVAMFPEWEKEIRMYYGRWVEMMGDQIPGMQEVVEDLRRRGFRLYGLSNWGRPRPSTSCATTIPCSACSTASSSRERSSARNRTPESTGPCSGTST